MYEFKLLFIHTQVDSLLSLQRKDDFLREEINKTKSRNARAVELSQAKIKMTKKLHRYAEKMSKFKY